MTPDQLEKINLLDTIFGALSVTQLREFAESEKIVAKLKGTDQNPQMLCRLVQEHDVMMLDLMNTKNDLAALRIDFQNLIKVLHADVFTPRYNQDFNTLKSKHGVY
jgi:hypothetical protein